MKPLRILHVDPERGWGGGEEQVLGLVRFLNAAGHVVTVAADPGGRLWPAAAAVGVSLEPLVVRHGFDARAAGRLRRLAREADIVHLHTARAHALAPWLARRGASRVVTRRMDYRPRPRAYARLLYNRCVDRVVAISGAIRDVLIATGVRAERISVIYSGVDVSRFVVGEDVRAAMRAEWHAPPDELVVLAVGGLVERKGHGVLVAAAARMRMRAAGLRLRFVIIGEGPLRGSLERAVSDARLEEVVHFAGRRTDIPRLLAGADVVALPSLHEGLGVAALEGMAAGRPVVASRVGGLAEAVLDGETGWLVPPGDAQALAERLTLVLSDVEGRRRMGGRAREWVAERYTMTRMATENERVYRMLRGNGSSDRTMGAEE